MEDLGDIEGHYIKMLFNEKELRDILKERSDTVWFYNLRTKFNYFSPLDYDPQYLFKKGETTPGARSGIMYIPTKKQLWDLLEGFTQTDFIIWKEENDIIDSIHFHSPAANFLKFFMEKKFNAFWKSSKGYWKRKEQDEFRINDYITLKLKHGQTKIYVNGQVFNQCKYLLINIPNSKVRDHDEIDSIDEASSIYSKDHETRKVKIPPKTEFWGHCSNLQAWFLNDYDTRLLHSNLSFPLLRKLADVGDPLAKKVFKQEIALRVESNYKPVIQFLINGGYFKYLNLAEIKALHLKDPILKFKITHSKLSSPDRRAFVFRTFMSGETKVIDYILSHPGTHLFDFDNDNLEVMANQLKQPFERFKLKNYNTLKPLKHKPIDNQDISFFENRIKIRSGVVQKPKINNDQTEGKFFVKISDLQKHTKKITYQKQDYYYFKERNSILNIECITILEGLFDLTEASLIMPKRIVYGKEFRIHVPGVPFDIFIRDIKELKSIFQMILSKKINQEHLWLREV